VVLHYVKVEASKRKFADEAAVTKSEQ